jgi:hypothetical protein
MAADPWKDYRRRRRLLILGTLSGLLVFVGSFPVAKKYQSERPLYVGLAVFLLVTFGCTAPLNDFACPKCGEPFTHKGRHRDMFTRKCLHCRHPLWADPGGSDKR